MPKSSTRIRDLPHFRISAEDLAKWIEDQGPDSWWSVDGDPLLMQSVGFPCPGEDLAAALRQLGKPLLLLDSREKPSAAGQTIRSTQLADAAYTDPSGGRVFPFCWEDGPDSDWLLVEDKESAARSRGLDDDEE
jgi:hypothetical protein